MKNQPKTPISNRGFDAQFLSIAPYANPLHLDGLIASVDSLRVKFTYRPFFTDPITDDREDTFSWLLFQLNNTGDWIRGQYDVHTKESRFKIGNYAYTVHFDLKDSSFAVLIGRYTTPNNAVGQPFCKTGRYVYEAVMDFNPNKIPAEVWHSIIGILSTYSLSCTIQRFDLALDFPIARSDLQLVQRPGSLYHRLVDRQGVVTEYTGERQHHAAIKLYDKAADLGLPELSYTRCELTLVPGRSESIQDVFPKILSMAPVDLSMDFSALPFQVQAVIIHPDLYDILKATTSPNTFRKYDKLIREYGQTYLELTDDQVQQIDNYISQYLTSVIAHTTLVQ